MSNKNIKATKAALDAAQPEHRLWLLKKAGKRYATWNLGIFCREVGATTDELGALLRDRAAQEGLRPADELIQAPSA